MIRKLKSGQYRLYSRKVNPKTGKRRNLSTFASRAAAEKCTRRSVPGTGRERIRTQVGPGDGPNTHSNAKSNISNGTKPNAQAGI